MLRYASVVSLLITICSAAATSSHGDIAKFTQSNATFLSIAEELNIQDDEIDAQYTSPLYGGLGGEAFNSYGGPVKTINIRSGSLIDSIQLVYWNGHSSSVRGGDGGRLSSFSLNTNEKIVAIYGRSGSLVDSLMFVTNTGRVFGPLGGSGGTPFRVSLGGSGTPLDVCNLSGMYGRSGRLLDAIGFHCS